MHIYLAIYKRVFIAALQEKLEICEDLLVSRFTDRRYHALI